MHKDKITYIKESVAQWIAWRLPGRVLLWACIRGFALATRNKSNKTVSDITYGDIYNAVKEEFSLHYL